MEATHTTLTVAQAAEALGVSERTVWRYLKSGRLSGHTLGELGSQRTLIDRDSVEALRTNRTTDPDAARLRADIERLTQQLAQVSAERDALAHRVASLQLAMGRAVPDGILGRAATGVVTAVARLRAVRAA
jgi:excisionase family DNA binding protein